MRKLFGVVLMFSALATAASAQIVPKGNIFAGYSYERFHQSSGNLNLNGWDGSVEGKFFLPWFGMVADVSGFYGNPSGIKMKEYNFLFGPRISFSFGKVRPFVHVLGGLARLNNSIAGFSDTDHSFAYDGGGGIDYKVLHLFAWRLQGDYLRTQLFGGTQKNVRVSTGLVFNF